MSKNSNPPYRFHMIRRSAMRYICQHFCTTIIGTLALTSTITAFPTAADEYEAFRKCVLEMGKGTECVSELPTDSKFISVLNNSNNTDISSLPYIPQFSWLPGGLNTLSAASILLQMQQFQATTMSSRF